MIQGWYWKGKLDASHSQGLKVQRKKVIKKIITFDSSKYLNMRVTFDIFTLTGWSSWRWPQKGVNSTVTIRWLLWLETWVLSKYTLDCNSDDYSLLR